MKKVILIIIAIGVFCTFLFVMRLRESGVIRVLNYSSLNTDFQFVCYPTKGLTVNLMEAEKIRYDSINNVNTIICREFKKEYLKIWNWYDYWTNPYYQYPYCK